MSKRAPKLQSKEGTHFIETSAPRKRRKNPTYRGATLLVMRQSLNNKMPKVTPLPMHLEEREKEREGDR